jgi:hypothetical protein
MNIDEHNEDRFGWQVRQLLNQGSRELPDSVHTRLASARSLALSRKRQEAPSFFYKLVPSLAGFGSGKKQLDEMSGMGSWLANTAALLPALLLAVSIGFIAEHQLQNRAVELAEIDTQVLGDDLPLSAYLDQGFSMFVGQKADGTVEQANTSDEETEPGVSKI